LERNEATASSSISSEARVRVISSSLASAVSKTSSEASTISASSSSAFASSDRDWETEKF